MLTYLRSLCYHNEESGEVRDQITLESGDLEFVLQVSAHTLRRWFNKLEEAAPRDNLLGPLYRVVESVKQPTQKVATTYWINLKTPLTPRDLNTYRQRLINGHDAEGVPDKKVLTEGEGHGQKVLHTLADSGQKVLHTQNGQGQEVPHTTQSDRQKVPHSPGGAGQKVLGSGTKEGSYKYYKILLNALGLEDFETLGATVRQEQQQLWHVNDNGAHCSFAAVAAEGSISVLLDKLGVQEPVRGRIEHLRPSCEEVMAWHLYAEQEAGLEQPLRYVIRRLLAGDPPPLPFLQLASLSWEQWRAYAAVSYLWGWLDSSAISTAESWPLFALWRELFGQELLADLPFGVGEGLEALQTALAIVNDADRAVSADTREPDLAEEAVACWEAALCELELQMTRATFNAWLRDAVLVKREGDTFVIGVHSEAARDWLANRMQRVIERTLSAVVGKRVGVQFVVSGGQSGSYWS